MFDEIVSSLGLRMAVHPVTPFPSRHSFMHPFSHQTTDVNVSYVVSYPTVVFPSHQMPQTWHRNRMTLGPGLQLPYRSGVARRQLRDGIASRRSGGVVGGHCSAVHVVREQAGGGRRAECEFGDDIFISYSIGFVIFGGCK